MSRIVHLCSYHMSQGALPVYDGAAPPSFVFSRGAWIQVAGLRITADENNELTGPTKFGVLRQLFGILLGAPEPVQVLLVAVRSYHVLDVDDRGVPGGEPSGAKLYVLQFALAGLPEVDIPDLDQRFLELPSWIRLDPGFLEEIELHLSVEDVMES